MASPTGYEKVDLSAKSIIVTGGGSEMGREASCLIASRGAEVTVVDLNAQDGSEKVVTINQRGGTTQFVRADVTSEDDAKNMLTAA